jgi:hypothetical protein
MKKIILFGICLIVLQNSKAQLVDLKNLDLSKLLGQTLQVKKGWAPKFAIGNINMPKLAKVGELFNLKKVEQANRLFKTFKTGRTAYKIGAYAGMATSLYSSFKNLQVADKLDKATVQAEIDKYKSQLKSAQSTLVAGGATILTGVLVKLLTKKAASKAADAFNGKIRKKLGDLLSVDAPSQSRYTTAGLALKIKL